jgi:hypothetical protein
MQKRRREDAPFQSKRPCAQSDLIFPVLTEEQKYFFKHRGYLVLENVLEKEGARQLRVGLAEFINHNLLAAHGEKFRIDPDDPKTYCVLSDAGYRQAHLVNPNVMYDCAADAKPNLNSALLSKTSGTGPLCNAYFLPEKEHYVTCNRKIFNAIRELYRLFPKHENLRGLLMEPDRMGIKAGMVSDVGSTYPMNKHLDTHPLQSYRFTNRYDGIYRRPSEPGDRLQALVCFSMNPALGAFSGTLEVLAGFHHYWKLYLLRETPLQHGIRQFRSRVFRPIRRHIHLSVRREGSHEERLPSGHERGVSRPVRARKGSVRIG